MVASLIPDFCKIRFNPASPLTPHTSGEQLACTLPNSTSHIHAGLLTPNDGSIFPNVAAGFHS